MTVVRSGTRTSSGAVNMPARSGAGLVNQRARSTYMVEALLILLILLVVACTVMVVFSSALQSGAQTRAEQEAIVMAQNTAERVAANPTAVPQHTMSSEYDIYCDIQADEGAAGVLYRAHITVQKAGEQLYDLHTSRYVSGRDDVLGGGAS